MTTLASSRSRPRVFNTALESGMRSLILLTSAYPQKLSLRRLVVLDYLLVHTGDLSRLAIKAPPPSLHPAEDSRAVELLVRRGLVSSGLSLLGTRRLIDRFATPEGFRYAAGDEAGTFVDYLRADYTADLKFRADWLSAHIVPLSDEELDELVREHLDLWAAEFQADNVGSV